ncbi:MAG: hypothetical protein M3T56_01455 [Chloroflexota bacterium]|nr:hypothetical protein [Chloroflexota bacterium]
MLTILMLPAAVADAAVNAETTPQAPWPIGLTEYAVNALSALCCPLMQILEPTFMAEPELAVVADPAARINLDVPRAIAPATFAVGAV